MKNSGPMKEEKLKLVERISKGELTVDQATTELIGAHCAIEVALRGMSEPAQLRRNLSYASNICSKKSWTLFSTTPYCLPTK